MKKILNCLLISVFSIVLVSCSSNTSEAGKQKPSSDQENNVTSTTTEAVDPSNKTENNIIDESEQKDGDKEEQNIIRLNEPIKFDDFIITIKDLHVFPSDSEEYPYFLRVDYDWENTGKEKSSPFMTFSLTGFQDGVETNSDYYFSDNLDLGKGQKEVKSGGKIIDAQEPVGIDDIDKPIDIELNESFSFDENTYTLVIKDLKSLISVKHTTSETDKETEPEITTIAQDELDSLLKVELTGTIESDIMTFQNCGGLIEKSKYGDYFIYTPIAIIKNTTDSVSKTLAVSTLVGGYQVGYELPTSPMDQEMLKNYEMYKPMDPYEERIIHLTPVVVASLDVPMDIVFSLPTKNGWGKCIYKIDNPRDFLSKSSNN